MTGTTPPLPTLARSAHRKTRRPPPWACSRGAALPRVDVRGVRHAGGQRRYGERIARIDHHGVLVGLLARVCGARGERLRVRAMREAARMERDHPWLDVVAAEEVAAVIEDHLVVVIVVVIERDLE